MNFMRMPIASIMIAIFGAIVLGNAPVGAREFSERRSWPEADADQEQDGFTSG